MSHVAEGSSLHCLWHILLLPHPSPEQKSLDLCCQHKEGFMRFKCVAMVELGLAFHVLPHHKKEPHKKSSET